MNKFRKFLRNTKAAMGPKAVITIAIAIFVFAIVFPMAMDEITGANTTGWETAVVTIFATLLPILAIIGVALKFLPSGK